MLTICDRASLEEASSLAHDGEFRMSDITFDESSQVFRLGFYLPDYEQAQYRRVIWPVSRRYLPFCSWELSFSSVQSYRVSITDEPNAKSLLYEIASIQAEPGETKILLLTHYVVTIELSVSAISGEVRQLSRFSPIAPLVRLVIRTAKS